MKKLRVGILFGGRSAEHEVSIQSAKSVYEALDKEKYEHILIGISKKGDWISLPSAEFEKIAARSYQALPEKIENVASLGVKPLNDVMPVQGFNPSSVDVVFPVLHGPYGEDGTIQGMLKTLNIPFVGAGVLGSAVGMDKDVMKRLLRDAGLPLVKFMVVTKNQNGDLSFDEVCQELGLPFFIKPANLGSSVGVSKVTSEREFHKAIDEAFLFDTKILIEEYIKGREIECAVLGNDNPIASGAGEIVPTHAFYSYEAKYLDENGAAMHIPAKISSYTLKKVQELAVTTFKVLCGSGLARVDFFLTEQNKLYVNEINTMPGFTKISMYPALWQESGVGYTELIDRLIELALEKYKEESHLQTRR